MNKKAKVQELIDLLDKVSPLHSEATQAVLATRERMEAAHDAMKQARLSLLRDAEGKNAEQREAWVMDHPQYQMRYTDYVAATEAFNRAYAQQQEHAATIQYIRDATALLREMGA